MAAKANLFQPAPTWKEIETHSTVEKVNKDLRSNQIKVRFEASNELIGSGASYINFKLHVGDN